MNSIASIRIELQRLGVKCPKEKTLQTISKLQENNSTLPKSKIFGIHLSDQEVTADSDHVPLFLVSITTHLLTYALDVGLFRKAGSVARQRDLRAELESGGRLEGSEPNDLASLLKQWLRELPVPVVPHCLHDVFAKCQNLEEGRSTAILLACLLLPPVHLQTLKHLLFFLARFALNSTTNKMDARNLSLVMAPNIFVIRNKNVDKNSNTMLQLHALATEFLIENADQVGNVPMGVTLQPQTILDLDSTGDLLDCSPCRSKRRRKSGGVQDLINGIRKLRRGTNSKTPEGILGAPKLPQKHKADSEDLSPSVKKRAVSSETDCNLNSTPINGLNLLSANGRNGSGRSRRRSFGLLRKKRSKHGTKSSTFHTKESPVKTHPHNNNSVVRVLEKPGDFKQESTSPPIPETSRPVTRSESIKKSASDSLLHPSKKEFAQSIAVSSSQSCLSNGTNDCFRHQTFIHEPGSLFLEIQTTLENREKVRKHEIASRDSATELVLAATNSLLDPISSVKSELMILSGKRSSLDKLCRPVEMKNSCDESSASKRTSGVKSVENGGNPRASQRKKNVNVRTSVTSKGKDSENATSADLIFEMEDSPMLDSPDLDTSMSNRRGITRQDGFILKSIRHKPKNAAGITKSLNACASQVTPKTTRVKKVEHDLKKGTSRSDLLKVPSQRKVARKTSRKGSIIRGRPNTVQSGLNSELCKRLNGTPAKGDELVNGVDKENLDASLTQKFKDFGFTSPDAKQELHMAFGVDSSFSFMDVSIMNSLPKKDGKSKQNEIKLEESTKLEPVEKRLSRSSDISNRIIPKLKLSLGSDKSSPFSDSDFIKAADLSPGPLKALENSRRSSLLRSSLPDSRATKISTPIYTPESRKSILSEANPDVFKTPSTNFMLSPNWTPARDFFDSPGSSEHEVTSKRESIAMILKRKHGHVQAKVSLYDNITKPPVCGSKSLSSAFSPGDGNGKMLRTYSEKNTPTHKRDSRSCGKKPMSGKSSGNKTRTLSVNSPLPPKFIFSHLETPSPELVDMAKQRNKNTQPLKATENAVNTPSPKSALKEVTNINSSFDFSPYKKSPGKSKMAKIAGENAGQLPCNEKQRSKRKTNSFSGNTPNALTKRILRSESSPLIMRSCITHLRMEENKNSLPVENALTMLKVNYS